MFIAICNVYIEYSIVVVWDHGKTFQSIFRSPSLKNTENASGSGIPKLAIREFNSI